MKLGQRIFILICLVINSFSNCSLVVSPNGYYNIYRENNFGNILNLKPTAENKLQDSYYPGVCSNAGKNKDGSHMVLGDLEYSKMSNVRTLLNIVCVEGSLLFSTQSVLYMSVLVMLPGGSFECLDCTIRFRELHPASSQIDPFGFFPGVLALGGSLSLIGKQKTTYSATNIGGNILEVPDLSTLDSFNGYSLSIFSESFPLGKSSTFSHYLNRISVLDLVIPKTDKNIREIPMYIENFYINSFGKTSNDQYSDTELVFSPDDPNLITEFINEHSNNVTIKNSVILETKETRSPLVIFGSNVNISGNIISSNSGSSITGFDKDCYSPCYNDSIRVSSKVQHLLVHQITLSFLFRISETGSKQSSIYKIKNSNLSYPISVLLENNAFILDNVYGFGDFSNNGMIKRFDIINSTLDPSASSSISLNNFSKAICIQNSFMDFKSFQKQNNQLLHLTYTISKIQ
ncbi:hypothetical protein ACTFIT_007819 [Dictyostelium discoideum]